MATKTELNVHELSQEEALELLNVEAQRCLNMTANEFIAAWKAGKFDGPERTEVVEVAMLLPLVDENLLERGAAA